MNIPLLLLMVVLLTSTQIAISQAESAYELEVLDFQDKSLGITTAITSDKDGFVWLSAGHGLVRYDGTNFIHITELVAELTFLGNRLHCLHVDMHNQLWIFKSDLGLLRLNLETFEWKLYDEFNRNLDTPFYYSFYESPEFGLFVPTITGLARHRVAQDDFEFLHLVEEHEQGVRFISGTKDNEIPFSNKK